MIEKYQGLYDLQDQVLKIVFGLTDAFYLSGGTALSRFYLHHRYSDDLDFFTGEVSLFPELFRLVRSEIPGAEILIDAKDFKRLIVPRGKLNLKVDFIADRVGRVGLPCVIGDYKVDSVRNILSNKLGTLLGRDEARDVADVLYIARSYCFGWDTVLTDAQTKDAFELDEIVFRMRSFPPQSLSKIPFMVPVNLQRDAQDWQRLIEDLENTVSNSLAPLRAPGL